MRWCPPTSSATPDRPSSTPRPASLSPTTSSSSCRGTTTNGERSSFTCVVVGGVGAAVGAVGALLLLLLVLPAVAAVVGCCCCPWSYRSSIVLREQEKKCECPCIRKCFWLRIGWSAPFLTDPFIVFGERAEFQRTHHMLRLLAALLDMYM